jgi:exodeoxyribonuclease V alpha subunit
MGRAKYRSCLAESQVAAIRLALISKVLVMTGGPGVGKTTISKAILRILAASRIITNAHRTNQGSIH